MIETDLQTLAQMAVDGGHYWKQRAEQAEAVLQELIEHESALRDDYGDCLFCDMYRHHDSDCLLARALVLVQEHRDAG